MSSSIIFDLTLLAPIRDTATQLIALSWGKQETPPISFEELSKLTGKSIPTLYAHMGVLRRSGRLAWRSAGISTIIVTFIDGMYCPNDSSGLELPDHINPLKESTLNEKINTCDSSPLEFPADKNSTAGTNAIKTKYCELLGYKPDGWAEGESKAAKAIGEKYTLEQFERVYSHMKAQPFWQDKHLMLRQIKPQMQGVLAYLSKNGHGGTNGGNGNGSKRDGALSPEDERKEQAIADEINRRRAAKRVQNNA